MLNITKSVVKMSNILPVWRKTSWAGNDQSDRENHGFIAIIFPPNLLSLLLYLYSVLEML
jgi:hypothetical protein